MLNEIRRFLILIAAVSLVESGIRLFALALTIKLNRATTNDVIADSVFVTATIIIAIFAYRYSRFIDEEVPRWLRYKQRSR